MKSHWNGYHSQFVTVVWWTQLVKSQSSFHIEHEGWQGRKWDIKLFYCIFNGRNFFDFEGTQSFLTHYNYKTMFLFIIMSDSLFLKLTRLKQWKNSLKYFSVHDLPGPRFQFETIGPKNGGIVAIQNISEIVAFKRNNWEWCNGRGIMCRWIDFCDPRLVEP